MHVLLLQLEHKEQRVSIHSESLTDTCHHVMFYILLRVSTCLSVFEAAVAARNVPPKLDKSTISKTVEKLTVLLPVGGFGTLQKTHTSDIKTHTELPPLPSVCTGTPIPNINSPIQP